MNCNHIWLQILVHNSLIHVNYQRKDKVRAKILLVLYIGIKYNMQISNE